MGWAGGAGRRSTYPAVGVPVVSLGTARVVADALRRSPEFRAI